MGKHFIVRLSRPDKVVTLPILPMYEVARNGKGIVGIILSRRIVSLEIKHHIEVAHLGYLSIARNNATHLVGKDRIAIIALPFLHIIRQGNANALCLQAVGWINATCIVKHHETVL